MRPWTLALGVVGLASFAPEVLAAFAFGEAPGAYNGGPLSPSGEVDSIALRREADLSRRYAVPPSIVPCLGQVSENGSHPPRQERWNVFHDDPSGEKFANGAGAFNPQPRSFALEPGTLAVLREIRTGEPEDEGVDRGKSSRASVADIGDAPVRVGPAAREYLPAEGLLLDLEDNTRREAGLIEGRLNPEIEAADTREERTDADRSHDKTCSIAARAIAGGTALPNPRTICQRARPAGQV